MKNFKIVNGTYGSGKTTCKVLVCETSNGNWYCAKGSSNVNKTYQDINEGVNIEHLSDFDYFSYSKYINTLNQLDKAINS